MNTENKNIYQEIVRITSEYLGPAGQRFVDRHIENHLKKSPSDISVADIDELAKWIKASMSILTKDQQLVEEHTDRILNLAMSSQERISNAP